MSIIEKAASRIDRQRSAVVPTGAATLVTHIEAGAVDAAAVGSPALANAPHDTPHAAPPMSATPAAAPAPKGTTRRIDLDLARMRELGMVTAAAGRTPLLEDFRIIKRPLLQRAFTERAQGDNPGNLIMVTSSLPGEGKTYTAINLAMSIAMELDHTVLLVDADVARPSVLRTLGLPNQRGLMDILVDDKLDMADVMLRTNVDTLSILPAGTSTPRATELLASSTDEHPGQRNRQPLSRPGRHFRFAAAAADQRIAGTGVAHGPDLDGGRSPRPRTQHAVKEALSQLEGMHQRQSHL